MSKQEYILEADDIRNNTELTSAVSLISYEIENANYNKLNTNKIKNQINKIKDSEHFPNNLEYLNSHTDPITGTTASAFKNMDTGKVIVGMTGTNFQKEAIRDFMKDSLLSPYSYSQQKIENLVGTVRTLQDIGADANIAVHIVTDEDPHFKSTQEYIKDLKKTHEIDTITGHSLGGRDAMILGMSNDIENIVTYNTAPLYLKNISELFNTNETSKSDRIDYLINNYDGNITNFISEDDQLDWLVKANEYVLPGKQRLIKNGEDHSMTGFMGKFEQGFIQYELNKVNDLENVIKKFFKKNSNYTKNKLNDINDIKSVMIMQNGGGALSSSQQKLLEYVTALAIVKGLSQQISEDIEQIKNMYDEMKDLFQVNWEDALESGHTIGKNLSSQEVLSALKAGDAYEDKMVTTPIDKINEKVKKLNATATQYREFITKVEDSIDEIINNDQMLANQIGGLL